MRRRKSTRLPGFDYSAPGAYFLTVCTHLRQPCLGRVQAVGAGSPGPCTALSAAGEIVARWVSQIPVQYPSVSVPKFAVMPDHIHLILYFDRCKGPGDPAPTPTLGSVMGWFKYQTAKEVQAASTSGQKLWQRGYYEHALRGERDYRDCVAYIERNPAAWLEKSQI